MIAHNDHPLRHWDATCTACQVEACLDKWTSPSHIRLHAGEMSAAEMRSVLAVVRAIIKDLVPVERGTAGKGQE